MTQSKTVFTTRQVARLLGISVTSVQQLMEAGEVAGWKTQGGHRRIPAEAVQAYQSRLAGKGKDRCMHATSARLTVLIVEHPSAGESVLASLVHSWRLPIDLSLYSDSHEALIGIARGTPDVVLIDLVVDAADLIGMILSYPDFSAINIAVMLTEASEQLSSSGAPPVGITCFARPLNDDELRGYLRACHAAKLRLRNTHTAGNIRLEQPNLFKTTNTGTVAVAIGRPLNSLGSR